LDRFAHAIDGDAVGLLLASRGWLRAIRKAVGFTQAELAAKIGVRRQSYAQFEIAEENSSVTLASLRRSADAMGCELVYFLRPRADIARSYSELAGRRDRGSVAESDEPEHPSDALPIGLL
jgi:transcriptional regulator with XRE-family HTH domain